MEINQAKIFNTFLSYFAEAEFPLMLSYNIQEPESFYDDPLPTALTDIFLEQENEDEPYDEFVPVARFRINKELQACLVWKASTTAYEFLLFIYDKNGNILESESVAGVFYASEPITYRVAEFIEPKIAYIIESTLSPDMKSAGSTASRQFKLIINEQGEVDYLYLENPAND